MFPDTLKMFPFQKIILRDKLFFCPDTLKMFPLQKIILWDKLFFCPDTLKMFPLQKIILRDKLFFCPDTFEIVPLQKIILRHKLFFCPDTLKMFPLQKIILRDKLFFCPLKWVKFWQKKFSIPQISSVLWYWTNLAQKNLHRIVDMHTFGSVKPLKTRRMKRALKQTFERKTMFIASSMWQLTKK